MGVAQRNAENMEPNGNNIYKKQYLSGLLQLAKFVVKPPNYKPNMHWILPKEKK